MFLVHLGDVPYCLFLIQAIKMTWSISKIEACHKISFFYQVLSFAPCHNPILKVYSLVGKRPEGMKTKVLAV